MPNWKPDGYNIGLYTGAAPAFILPFMEKLPYDTLKDFKFIMLTKSDVKKSSD